MLLLLFSGSHGEEAEESTPGGGSRLGMPLYPALEYLRPPVGGEPLWPAFDPIRPKVGEPIHYPHSEPL